MRKQLFLMLMMICTLCPNLYAAPASQSFVDIVQPDGTTLKARQQGDEFQRWTETKSGHTILRNPKTKYWDYAGQDANGRLKASGYRAMEGLAPAHIPPRLKPPRNKTLEQYKKKSLHQTYQERLQRAPSSSSTSPSSSPSPAPAVRRAAAGDWSPIPVAGERKLLVVLINFSDRTLQTTPAGWDSTVFSPTAKSVARYYADNSFSSFGISPAAHSQPDSPAGIITVSIAAPHPYLDGDNDPEETYATEPALINLALAQAATVVNFSAFDTNSNGTLENSELTIYFIYAGYEASGSNEKPSVWAHAWGDGGVTAGGLNVTDWALSGELNNDGRQHGMGIIAHELGHALCGLPDLYDTSYTNAGMGIFSLMATGLWGGDSGEDDGTTPTNLDLWSREYLGWATPAEPGSDGTLAVPSSLSARDSGYKLQTPLSESEFYLLENRHPSGWDLGAKNDLGTGWEGGLLLSHIDISAGSVGANDINDFRATEGRQGVSPVQANKESCDMALEASCWGNAKTLFYANNNIAWTALTAPDSNYYDGTPTNFSLTAISSPGETMTAAWSTIPIILPPVIDDFESGDLTKLPWLTSGIAHWTVTASGYKSTSAAEAPISLLDDQSATLQTTVVTGDGTLTFRYKVDSEVNYDFFIFFVDGVEQGRWSGSVNWSRLVYPLTAGTHTLSWEYKKDGSISSGLDAAWIDDLSFPARYELSTLRAGNGSGNVIADVGTLTWTGDTGSATYDNGTVVTITAAADPGSTFTGWEEACSGSGSCVVTMDAAKEVVAKFVITATIPTITAFTLPATSNSLSVAISSFTATDNDDAVTGYCLTETNNSSGCSWSAAAPTDYLFASAGNQTLYAFARDAAGNISTSRSATTTIDTTTPTITAFTLPATSNSLNVAISSFGASDNLGVLGYCLAESDSSSGCVWNALAPTSYPFASAGSKTLYAFAKDAVGNISASRSASTSIDITAPIVTAFTLPATTGSSLSIAISSFSASDNIGVTGYCLVETNNSSDCNWSATTLTSYLFASDGSKILYAFVQDAAGNISASRSATTLLDTTTPAVTAFTLPATSSSLNVAISSFSASDTEGVTGYCLAESNSSSGCSWSASVPASYPFASAGDKTLFAFARDAAGNISASRSASISIDTTAPTITAFNLPATGGSLSVAISSFSASDTVAVTGYCLVESNNSSGCSWSATVPTSYPFASGGSKVLYAFARDAAGNISGSASASTFIDIIAPTVSSFSLPPASNSLNVAISSLTASDTISVTGYCLMETDNSSDCSWSASAPASYLFASAGSKTLYAFARDAVGNISGSASASTSIDIIAPTVSSFSLPTTSNSLIVAINSFSVSDNSGVTGYCLTETDNSSGCSWSASAPASYLFASDGSKVLYAFAQDGVGNISARLSASTTIDTFAPTVTAFSLPATGSSLSVAISNFTASDSSGVTGYCLLEIDNSSGCSWSAVAPASYLFASAGSKILYAFARDAAGNIAASRNASTTIDTTTPTVTAFTLPATSNSLNVSISSFTATDNGSVTGYCLAETDSSSGCAWSSAVPASYHFASEGLNTLYAFVRDAAGNISASANAGTTITLPDIIAPTIDNFTLPATGSNLSVAISGFAASDAVGVTGYCLIETDNSSGCSWSAAAPASYLFVHTGNKTLYAFAQDAAGNISASRSASTTIFDVIAPTVTDFILPATSNSLSVAISNFSASDAEGVTGYCLTETDNSSDCGWSVSAPTSNLFTSDGSKTLYAFAKDAAGNISASRSASTTIDTTAPTVTAFTLPATTNSLIIPINSLTANDAIGVTGYCLAESNNSSGCTWSVAPASYPFASAGNKTLYAFARDAAGNISASRSATTTIDTFAPTVTAFSLPAISSSLSVPVSSFSASDTVGVTGYCLAATDDSSGCSWSASAPPSYLFAGAGNKTLYAFAQDAAGNISGGARATTSIDTIAPTVTAFSLPATGGSLDVAISFSASDSASVTGYCLTETDNSSGCSWSASAPTSYLFASDGSKVLYAFARDAAGNISASRSATTTIDTTAPAVTAFTLPAISSSLSVPVSSFSASDSVDVTGYCLTEANSSNGCAWSAATPASYTFTTAGSKTLYAFARDAAGNISASRSAGTTIDTTAPSVTAFSLPAISSSLGVTISSFSASDTSGVTGYCLAATDDSNGCSWSASAPPSYLFAGAGNKTLYAFAQDAAGNISVSRSATTTIDTTAPTVTTFTLPTTTVSNLNVPISLTASDNVEVTDYCLTETNSSSGCAWSAAAPTGHLFASDGSKTLYVFARDAAGNISVSRSANTTIDITAPTITTFSLPAISSSLSVAINSFSASDTGGVTGYCLTETNNFSGCAWSAAAPTSYLFASAGSKTLYAFARDAVGYISGSLSATTTVIIAAPSITAFSLPAMSNSLSVAISSFSASDTGGVTGYCLAETDNSSGCAWNASAPTSYLFASDGSKTLYAFAQDADGNISESASATTMIDSAAPSVTAFSLPATSNKLNVTIIFTATDVDVTGYCLKQTDNSSGCTWNTTAPNFFTFTSAGNKTLYAFVRDAAGNISASRSASTAIDITAPEITTFSLAATSNSLTVAISNFNVIDNFGVTGYCLSENNASSGCTWSPAEPTGFTFTSAGSKTLYAFTQDAAGNISASRSASTTIDTTIPIITAFTLPATSNSLTVVGNITTDNVGVTAYLLNESGAEPLPDDPAWQTTAGYTFTSAGNKTLYAFAQDAAGNISQSASASTTIDIAAPNITAFTLPATSNSLSVAINSFTASDNIGMTGYCLMETNNSSGCNWSATTPSSYLFTSAGNKVLYAFVADAAGNISASANASITIDTTAPTVTDFTLPATSSSLSVVGTITATDSVGVTSYLLNESGTKPLPDDSAWRTTAGYTFTFTSAGTKTLYAFAKDAVGNISESVSASTTIDTTAPTITAFTLPATSNSLSVVGNITTDNVGVTAYLLSESEAEPLPDDPAWETTAGYTYSFTSAGNKTLYAFAKDAAGNISQSANASTMIDTTAPTVTAFTLPAASLSLSIDILSFTATDSVGVTGYFLSESGTKPLPDDPEWTATSPYSFTFTTEGSKTLYAFTKDAAGNISNSASANTTIDTTRPAISAFTLPATSSSLSVVGNISATDNVAVTGYFLSESGAEPMPDDPEWKTTAAYTFTFPSAGNKTLYAFTQDAAGNISQSASANTTITDITAPTVTFTLPASSHSLSVAIGSFIASDEFGVTGFCLSASNDSSGCSWDSSAPAGYQFVNAGTQTLYAFAQDAAGNISSSTSASTTITDITAPTVTFTLPGTSHSLTVAISSFTANDEFGVTGYCLSESNDSSGCIWTDVAPTSYPLATAGDIILYAFARDGAGNISNSVSASPTITDIAAPSVTFTLPATSHSLTVAISSFTASDEFGMAGYCLSASNDSSGCIWDSSAPASYPFATAGAQTLYAFAKDTAGNISGSVSASTSIVIYGDLNNDNEANSYDALLAMQMAVGKTAYDPKADLTPFVDGAPYPDFDGKITAADAWLILRKSVGLW